MRKAGSIMLERKTDENYQLLALAIVKSAMAEYLDIGKAVVMRGGNPQTAPELQETRKFFKSEWGENLVSFIALQSDITANDILCALNRKLKKYAEQEKQ